MTADSPDIVHVVALLKAKPGQAATLRDAALALVGQVRPEPGCILYTLHVDRDDPSHLAFYESWANQAALDAHNQTPHLQAFAATLGDLLAEPIRIIRLEKLA
jgi:quinol monooxygenase YgiN